MKAIQMCDLKSQYMRLKPELDEAVFRVLASGQYIKGSEVEAFESELADYMGVKHVIGCANGTDALQISLMALDLQPGDEVITPSFTYAATVEVIKLLKLIPVYVDVELDTFNLKVDEIEALITDKTRAIVPVHLYGQCCNMEKILQIAQKNNLFVIEDNAQAIGSDFVFSSGEIKKAGTIGDIGTTSFFPAKNLGCYGDGGAIFTNDDKLAEKMRKIANHGQSSLYTFELIGINSRLDAMQAAILRIKLKNLNSFITKRREVATFYDNFLNQFPDIQIPQVASFTNHVHHQYTIKISNGNRDRFKEFLQKNNIPSMVYYPKPMHIQPAYKIVDSNKFMLKNSEYLPNVVLSLPIHTEFEDDQYEFFKSVCVSFF